MVSKGELYNLPHHRATNIPMQTDPCVWFVHAYVHIALFLGRPPLVGAGAVRPSFPPTH